MFRLKKDTDFAWVSSEFGDSGIEKYKISFYSPDIIIELLKKYGHRDSFFWRHKETKVEVNEEPKDIDKYDQLEKIYEKNIYDITDDNALKLRQDAFNRVLLDWDESICDEFGKPARCGESEKRQFVIDSPVRVTWLLFKARNLFSFLPDLEQDSKNSKRLSNTKKDTGEVKSNSRIAEPVSQ